MQDHDSTVAGRSGDDPIEDDALSELREIRDRLQPLDVMEGLSTDQQFTLVDRVWLCHESHLRSEGSGGAKEHGEIMEAFRKRTPKDLARLDKKLARVREAWTDLLKEVGEIHKRGNVHLAYLLRQRSVVVPGADLHIEKMLDGVTRALDAVRLPSEDRTTRPPDSQVVAERALRDHAVWILYRFFSDESRLDQNEAEVRVAKIGNALWQWNLEYTERYDPATGSKGCPAIRQWLKRTRPSTNS